MIVRSLDSATSDGLFRDHSLVARILIIGHSR